MPRFEGRLNANEIFASIFNMIISQEVFADNIKKTSNRLVNKAKTDGTLFGDQKLYYATDVLSSRDWLNDAEAQNLLAVNRPKDPEVQSIEINVARQIDLTLDNYLSKRAWGDENSFSQFTSVSRQWIYETKKIYDITTYNAFFGTNETNIGGQQRTINLSAVESDTSLNTEEKARLKAQKIGEHIANLEVDMTDVSRDFNDYGFMRSYDDEDIQIVWNSKFANAITHIDLPTIFHKDGIVKGLDNVLPSKYFGKVITEDGTVPADKIIRALKEKKYGSKDYFAGEQLPTGTSYKAGEVYEETDDIICKVITKLPPYMSGFEVGTSFFNARSLTENQYLTWLHNTLEHLKNYPFITIRKN